MNGQNTYSKSVMAPALSIISVLIVLTIIGAILSGGFVLLALYACVSSFIYHSPTRAPVTELTMGIMIFINCFVSILSLYILKCFALCFDLMEQALRKIEYNTRKED